MKRMQVLALLGLAACASAGVFDGFLFNGVPQSSDEITDLPGAPPVKFKQYSGYLDIPNGKHIFYWFVESQRDPANDPVVYWTNGGPGCSGVSGLLSEHGPFRPNAQGTLDINPTSWNTIVNMLYVEQPVGVGFSYAENPKDYRIGDYGASVDNYNSLKAFFAKHPQFSTNDFYITSESYGGHYMPTLAQQIIQRGGFERTFKGFLVGNPYTDPVENAIGMYGTWFGHSLVNQPDYELWEQNCLENDNREQECEKYEEKLNRQVGNLNPYALDFPVCLDDDRAMHRVGRHERWTFLQALNSTNIRHFGDNHAGFESYEPCVDDYMTTYLNKQGVQEALHVAAAANHRWGECGGKVRYNRTDMNTPMEPVWHWLIQNRGDLKFAIMSGDDDSVCGSLGTQHWMYKGYEQTPGFTARSEWNPWTDSNGQVGGYLTKFDGFSFITVHGAGHMCPSTKPQRTLDVLNMYLNGTVNA